MTVPDFCAPALHPLTSSFRFVDSALGHGVVLGSESREHMRTTEALLGISKLHLPDVCLNKAPVKATRFLKALKLLLCHSLPISGVKKNLQN